ncbi:MAG: septal ring lytic transglycosylase RlpA family protein [Spirochaetales bacterium]|jgi:hypothetical protein|nr:septal ring lytic transglycosylase RlpA family protein [Spirochaetales bacterium]
MKTPLRNPRIVKLLGLLFIGLLIPLRSFAQSQTGNATYNASSPPGMSLRHNSLSINTRVRITNLENQRSVEAVVINRIPRSDQRIADISREAGDALGMRPEGMTLVEIVEIFPSRPAPPEPPAPPQPEAPAQPAAPAAPRPSPAPPAAPAPAEPSPPAASPEVPAPEALPPSYLVLPGAPACCSRILLWVIFGLLLLIILLLGIILTLVARKGLWPWYPHWFRRHYRYHKRRKKTS